MGDGFWADVHAGQHHLRLFAEVYELGYVAMLYDVNAHREIERRDVNNLDEARQLAEELATEHLRRLDGTSLPAVDWQPSAVRQAQERQQR